MCIRSHSASSRHLSPVFILLGQCPTHWAVSQCEHHGGCSTVCLQVCGVTSSPSPLHFAQSCHQGCLGDVSCARITHASSSPRSLTTPGPMPVLEATNMNGNGKQTSQSSRSQKSAGLHGGRGYQHDSGAVHASRFWRPVCSASLL